MHIPEELIDGCRRQKQAAQAELFRLLAPRLMGVCYRYSGSREDAEDLLQESFVLIFTRIDSYRSAGSFEGWARRIAVNVALNWLKKNKKIKEQVEFEQRHEKFLPGEEEEPEFPIQRDELMEQIARLPEGYRTILNLFAIEEFSHKEIADQLGITESTSRSQYTRAKRALTDLINANTIKKYEKF